MHSQSPHAVSVLCQSSPQSVVPEKHPLPTQLLAVLVGWTSSLLCVYHAPPVGGGGSSSLTGLNCRAAIPTRVACAAPNVLVPLLPAAVQSVECCRVHRLLDILYRHGGGVLLLPEHANPPYLSQSLKHTTLPSCPVSSCSHAAVCGHLLHVE